MTAKVYGSARGGGKTAALKAFVDVIAYETGKVVHTVETTPSKVDKVEAGIQRNLDVARYFVRQREAAK